MLLQDHYYKLPKSADIKQQVKTDQTVSGELEFVSCSQQNSDFLIKNTLRGNLEYPIDLNAYFGLCRITKVPRKNTCGRGEIM